MGEAQSYLHLETFNEFVHNFFLALFLSLDTLFSRIFLHVNSLQIFSFLLIFVVTLF